MFYLLPDWFFLLLLAGETISGHTWAELSTWIEATRKLFGG